MKNKPDDGDPLQAVILEQQAALEGLEAGTRELESLLEHVLTVDRNGAPKAPPTDRAQHLTKREMQVLGLMVAGKTSKEIAAELGISFKTAVTHRASIMGKLGVHETASVVREAIRRGMV